MKTGLLNKIVEILQEEHDRVKKFNLNHGKEQ